MESTLLKPIRLLKDVTETDLLIIPPTFGDTTKGILANAEAIPYFKKLYENGSSLASLCIGAFLLAETGLLNGKKCSTHWAHINEFREKYPEVEVEDGLSSQNTIIFTAVAGQVVYGI